MSSEERGWKAAKGRFTVPERAVALALSEIRAMGGSRAEEGLDLACFSPASAAGGDVNVQQF